MNYSIPIVLLKGMSRPAKEPRLYTNMVMLPVQDLGVRSPLAINSTIDMVSGQLIIVWSLQITESWLVYSVEDASAKGLLVNTELFLFTDNSTAESTFSKGTSKSKQLFGLILRFRKLQMREGIVMHMIHVSGLRMISQGTDGLSCGDTTAGVLGGAKFSWFVPFHLSALERQGSTLKDWVDGWYYHTSKAHWLQPEDWFHQGHLLDYSVWVPPPPPAAANVALEQLGKCVHKRPHHTHLFLCPRLMTATWRKTLGKICNLTFVVPLGADCWAHTQFEPLIVRLCLPLSRHLPWRLRGISIMDAVEGKMRSLPQTTPGWGRLVLRELLQQTRGLESLSESIVRPLLHGNRQQRVPHSSPKR